MFARAVVVACLASVALGNYYSYVPKCIKDGEKCGGAELYPMVHKKECCSKDYECIDVTGWEGDAYKMKGKDKGWGSHCLKKEEYKSCAKVGMRCGGEKGYDFVVYGTCCKGAVCEKVGGKWGKFCVEEKKPSYETKYEPKYEKKPEPKYVPKPEPKYKPAPEPKYVPKPEPKYEPKKPEPKYEPKKPEPKYDDKKCYGKGERCIGAPGKPYVEYLGCCDGMSCTGKKGGYDGWGLYCEEKKYDAKPYGHHHDKKKCYKEGERCIGAPGKPYVVYLGNDKWDGCCDGYTCTGKGSGYGAYGKYCEKRTYY